MDMSYHYDRAESALNLRDSISIEFVRDFIHSTETIDHLTPEVLQHFEVYFDTLGLTSAEVRTSQKFQILRFVLAWATDNLRKQPSSISRFQHGAEESSLNHPIIRFLTKTIAIASQITPDIVEEKFTEIFATVDALVTANTGLKPIGMSPPGLETVTDEKLLHMIIRHVPVERRGKLLELAAQHYPKEFMGLETSEVEGETNSSVNTNNYSYGLLTDLLLAEEACTVDRVARAVLTNFWKTRINIDEDTRNKEVNRLRGWFRFLAQNNKLSQEALSQYLTMSHILYPDLSSENSEVCDQDQLDFAKLPQQALVELMVIVAEATAHRSGENRRGFFFSRYHNELQNLGEEALIAVIIDDRVPAEFAYQCLKTAGEEAVNIDQVIVRLIEGGNGYKALRTLHHISSDPAFNRYVTGERLYSLHLQAIEKDPAGFVQAMKHGSARFPSSFTGLSDLQVRNLVAALAQEHPLFALRLIHEPEVIAPRRFPSVTLCSAFRRRLEESIEQISNTCFWRVVEPEFIPPNGKFKGWDLMILVHIALMQDDPGDLKRLQQVTQVINRASFSDEYMLFGYITEQLEERQDHLRYILLHLHPNFALKVLEFGSGKIVKTLDPYEIATLILDLDKRGYLCSSSVARIEKFLTHFFESLPDLSSHKDGTSSQHEALKRRALAVFETLFRTGQPVTSIKKWFEFLIQKVPSEEALMIIEQSNPAFAEILRNWYSE